MSKTCSNRSELSIAPTSDRFGHVQAKNDTIDKRWTTIPSLHPLKKHTSVDPHITSRLYQKFFESSEYWEPEISEPSEFSEQSEYSEYRFCHFLGPPEYSDELEFSPPEYSDDLEFSDISDC